MNDKLICPECKEAAARVVEGFTTGGPDSRTVTYWGRALAQSIRALPEKAGTQQNLSMPRTEDQAHDASAASVPHAGTECSEPWMRSPETVTGRIDGPQQNAAPGNGGQDVLASDSQESPDAGRCPDAAPYDEDTIKARERPDAAPGVPGMVRRWSFAGESGQWISEKDHEGVMTNYERLFKEVDTLRRENAQLRKRYDGDSKALIEALDRAESAERRVAELEKQCACQNLQNVLKAGGANAADE